VEQLVTTIPYKKKTDKDLLINGLPQAGLKQKSKHVKQDACSESSVFLYFIKTEDHPNSDIIQRPAQSLLPVISR